jgi:hypothetical protein
MAADVDEWQRKGEVTPMRTPLVMVYGYLV